MQVAGWSGDGLEALGLEAAPSAMSKHCPFEQLSTRVNARKRPFFEGFGGADESA
jgi:hypothetical protein